MNAPFPAVDPFAPAAGLAADGLSAVAAAGGVASWRNAADGVRLRTAHWPAAAGAACPGGALLLNGRTEFIEKHLESVAELRRRGWMVWATDWRGQGLSGRLTADPDLGHVGSFDEYLDDLDRWAAAEILPALAGRPLVLLAHSMGGQIGLRWLQRRPDWVARAMFSAPMVDFRRPGLPPGLARPLAEWVCRLPGAARRYGPGQGPPGPADHVFAGNRLTSCPVRFARQGAWQAFDRRLALGGASWGWIRAALESTAALTASGAAESLTTPVLLAAGGADRVVDNAAMAAFAARLPAGTLREIPAARHELLCEADPLRQRFWRLFDDFTAPVRRESGR